jgi:hypothetical protein
MSDVTQLLSAVEAGNSVDTSCSIGATAGCGALGSVAGLLEAFEVRAGSQARSVV